MTLGINYGGFKMSLITKIREYNVEIIEESDWELKILIDNDNYFSIDLKVPWEKFTETQDPEILHNFHKTQMEIIEWVLKKDYSYETCKERMLFAIRSSAQIEGLNNKESIISEKVGEDLFGVVLLNHTRFMEYMNHAQISGAPSAEEILEAAKENTLKQGWGQESQVHIGTDYEILAFNEHVSHYQFLVPEWVERKLGDCFIAFPSNRVALVLRFNEGIDWKNKVEGLEKFTNSMNACSRKSSMPLSDTIVQFSKNNYKFVSKI